MKFHILDIKSLARTTFSQWREHKAPKLAAGLAYYTVFSIPPLLLIAIGVASIFFGQEVARGQLMNQITGLVGPAAAEGIQGILKNFQQRQSGGIATAVGIITLLLGATGVFAELQDTLNRMWEVKPKKTKGMGGYLRKRLFSFGMVLVIGFLLLVSLAFTTFLSAALKYVGQSVPVVEVAWQIISFAVSFGLITVLFAAMFRLLPDAKIAWRDLWMGAAITALLFTIGKFLIGIYLGRSSTASAFGAAGTLVVMLLWVYYSAQIFFLGAEFTQSYAHTYGSGIILNEGAEHYPDSMGPFTTPQQKELLLNDFKRRRTRNFDETLHRVQKREEPFAIQFRMTLNQIRNLFRTKKMYFATAGALVGIAIFMLVLEKRGKDTSPH